MEKERVLEKGMFSKKEILLISSLSEAALRFVIASMLFEYDFETSSENDSGTIQDLERDFRDPWRRSLILQFSQRLGKDEGLDIQGYSIINVP
jgi:hypothetical protein